MKKNKTSEIKKYKRIIIKLDDVVKIDKTLYNIFKEYMKYQTTRQISFQRLRTYEYSLRYFAYFLINNELLKIPDIKYQDIERFQKYLMNTGLSIGYSQEIMSVLRMFFLWLNDTGKIFKNPCKNIILPKRTHKVLPIPTEDELKSLLSQPDILTPIGIRDRAILEVAYSSGLRRSELENLSVRDIDFKNGSLRVIGKGKKERIIPLGKHAVFWVKKYIKEARAKLLKDNSDEISLWISEHHRKIGNAGIYDVIRKHTKRAGIKTNLSPHSLRRACVTYMLRNGAGPVHIQMLLGHSSLKHIKDYVGVSLNDIQKTHSKSNVGR
ncbi:MAG: tyrosine-type recombinase/integrase [Desulfobacterales bacterium]|nr:tyrosine-type recombinase/integrase [Desulfobacterales bacterium]